MLCKDRLRWRIVGGRLNVAIVIVLLGLLLKWLLLGLLRDWSLVTTVDLRVIAITTERMGLTGRGERERGRMDEEEHM